MMKSAVLLLLLGLVSLQAAGAAPGSKLDARAKTGFTTINNREYYIAYFEEPRSADEAIQFCGSLDMALVSFESQLEYDAVDYYLWTHYMYFMDFWSGGRRVDDAWQWPGGAPFTFTAWFEYEGQPDELWRDEELCVSFMSHSLGWSDAVCTTKLNFICEQL